MVRLLPGDESELHRRSFAKKAAAFRRISRSSRRIRYSFRSGRAPHARRWSGRTCPGCDPHGRASPTRVAPFPSDRSRGPRCPRSCLHRARAGPLGFEVVIESPAGPALGSVCHRTGHRSRLSLDVHEPGSNAQTGMTVCVLRCHSEMRAASQCRLHQEDVSLARRSKTQDFSILVGSHSRRAASR
jgi:hypothetical protein